jgi:Protein of unknown function (DUF3551)
MSARCPSSACAGVWLALTVLVGCAMDIRVASAQPAMGNARWCVTIPLGAMLQCSYHSLEQCMFYARGVSNQCSLNPWYEGPPEPPRKRPRRGTR